MLGLQQRSFPIAELLLRGKMIVLGNHPSRDRSGKALFRKFGVRNKGLVVTEFATNGLSGSISAPFGLINPGQTRADFVPSIEVEIVSALHEKGILVPAAVPGKKMMYRKNPR